MGDQWVTSGGPVDQSMVLTGTHKAPDPGCTPSFSLLVRNLSMFAIMCLLTLAMTSLNSRVMPAFMMRGFLQIALAILSSTRRPSASWVWAAQRSSRRPLLELAIDSKRSATASGLTRLFSMLRDLTWEFSSRTAHSVDTAQSLRSQLQAENLTHLSLFLSAVEDVAEKLLRNATDVI